MAKRSAEDDDWQKGRGKRKRVQIKAKNKAKSTRTRATSTRQKKSKATKKSRRQPLKKPCMFLQLPRELRDYIYSSVAAASKATIDKRGGGTLNCSEALSLVNKQIRSEFLSALYLDAGLLATRVVNFNFSNIITFFNRLSEREDRKLLGKPESSETEARKLEINLFVSRTCDPEPYNTGLKRWINRFANSAKRGTHLECTYTLAVDDELRAWASSDEWQSSKQWLTSWHMFRLRVIGAIDNELYKVVEEVRKVTKELSLEAKNDKE